MQYYRGYGIMKARGQFSLDIDVKSLEIETSGCVETTTPMEDFMGCEVLRRFAAWLYKHHDIVYPVPDDVVWSTWEEICKVFEVDPN